MLSELDSGDDAQAASSGSTQGSVASVAEHSSNFGLAPHFLALSGFDCPGGHNAAFNGRFEFGGLTGEGRPWYRRDSHWLYYDKACFDNAGGRWILTSADGLDFGRQERFADACHVAASLLMEEGAAEKFPNVLDLQPAAVPPQRFRWLAWCGDSVGWAYLYLTFENGAALPIDVSGRWKFLFSGMPEQEVKIQHGVSERTSQGRALHLRGRAKIEMGGSVGYPVFGARASVSLDISAKYEALWSEESSHGALDDTTFKLPASDGSAVWQFELVATARDGDEGSILTRQFAFTEGAWEAPKCFPGGSKDHFKYQCCQQGWVIDDSQTGECLDEKTNGRETTNGGQTGPGANANETGWFHPAVSTLTALVVAVSLLDCS